MVLKKIIYIILFFFTYISYVYTLYTPNLLFQNKHIYEEIRTLTTSLASNYFILGCQSNFYLSYSDKNIQYKIQKNPELIDIIICNHISCYDTGFILMYLKKFNISHKYYFIKSSLNYVPGFGTVMYANLDIKVNRNWYDDQLLIKKQLDKIINNINNKKQVIIIFVEGTRLTNKNILEGHTFSKNNNLHVFNNLLVPKTKGLYFIINYLSEHQKLGKLWDISLVIDKLKCNFSMLDDMNNIYGIIKEVNLDQLEYNSCKKSEDILEYNSCKKSEDILENNSSKKKHSFCCEQLENNSSKKKHSFFCEQEFKNKFLNLWKEKDNILSNFDKYEYEKLDVDINYLDNIQITIIILLFLILMTFKYTRYYLLLSILIWYIIIIFKIKI